MDSKLMKAKDKNNEHIQVFVRVRPLNTSELNSKSPTVVDTTNKEVVVNERPTDRITKTFSFDKVFGQDSKQISVYKAVVAPLIEEVLAGYNCTVFAYGQTGTGKTFTMEGDRSNDPGISWDNDPSSGIIPRTLSHLFDELRVLQAEYTVRVSFLELYNEELFDLLSPADDTSKLKLYEDVNKKGSVIVHGLEEVPVHNKNEVYQIMEKGSLKRQTASTLMNAKSSRSHTIFSITVHIKENSLDGEELLKTGKLNLVDLAGSENVGRSGAIDKRAREAGNINQSLLTLGRCIKSLVERTPHVPYRESKLTRLLQDSLGGKTKTSIIATISPAGCSLEETLSTLDYAHRAKNITNRPEINQKLTKKFLLREYTEEIERLRKDLMATREGTGICVAKENYQQMVNDLENLQTEMAEKIGNIKALTEELEKKEEVLSELGMDLKRCTKELTLTNKLLKKSRRRLRDTEQERDEQSHLVEKHMETETKLGQQANHLLAVAEESTVDTYKLHDKLQRKLVIEDKNSRVSNAFLAAFDGNMERLVQNLGEFTRDQLERCENMQAVCGKHLTTGLESLKEKQNILSTLYESLGNFSENMLTNIAGQENFNEDCKINFLAAQASHYTASCESIDEFMKKVEGLLQSIVSNIGNVLKVVHEEMNTMPEKLDSHQNTIREHCKNQLEGFVALQETVAKIVENDRMEIEASQKKVSQLQDMHEMFVANIQSTTQNWLKESTQIRKELQSGCTESIRNGNEITEAIAVSLNENTANCGLLEGKVDENLNSVRKNCETLETESSKYLRDSQKISELLGLELTSEQTLRKEVLTAEKSRVDQDIKSKSNLFASELQNQKVLIEDANKAVQVSAEAFKASFQDQNDELENYSTENQNSVRNQADQLGEWSTTVRTELQSRKQEVFKFVNNDLHRDVPTGGTPARKDFQYTRVLAATSPHQRIVERYRVSRPCILNDSFTDSDTNTMESPSECDQTFYIEEELKSLGGMKTSSLRRSMSTSDIRSLDSDNVLNISTISEREGQHENKENSALNLRVPPAKAMANGNSRSLNNVSKSRVDSGLKRPLMAQNQSATK